MKNCNKKRFHNVYQIFVCAILLSASFTSRAQNTTLPQLIQIAVQNNLGVQIAKNEVAIGSINNNWGNAGALPTINANINKSFASNSIEQELTNGTSIKRDGAAVNNLNSNVLISWRFFDGYRMFATKKRLAELEKIGQQNFTKQANETVYNVILAYYNIVQLQQQLNAINEVIALNKERLNIAEAKLRVGTGTKTDVLQAQVDVNEQLSLIESIQNSIAQTKTNINLLLAREASTHFTINDTLQLTTNINIAELQQKVIAQNPDALMANSQLQVLMQTKREINAQRLPTASLNSNYNFNRNKSEAGFTLLNQNYGPTVGIGVAIPIFNGGVIKQQLKVADINITNQQLSITQIKNQLLAALNNAFNNYNNGKKLAEMELKNLQLIQENNLINIERFKKLSITSIELRQGQVNYSNAQNRLINALFQSKIAEAEMLLLSGQIL
jgi:outer membrane protein